MAKVSAMKPSKAGGKSKSGKKPSDTSPAGFKSKKYGRGK